MSDVRWSLRVRTVWDEILRLSLADQLEIHGALGQYLNLGPGRGSEEDTIRGRFSLALDLLGLAAQHQRLAPIPFT